MDSPDDCSAHGRAPADLSWIVEGEGAGVVVLGANLMGEGIAVRDCLFEEVRSAAAAYEDDEYGPRLLIATVGSYGEAELEWRLELQLLRLLLEGARWCRWVDFQTVSAISKDPAEIDIVCGWIERADAQIRLESHDALLSGRMLRAVASRLLEIETRADAHDEF